MQSDSLIARWERKLKSVLLPHANSEVELLGVRSIGRSILPATSVSVKHGMRTWRCQAAYSMKWPHIQNVKC